MAAQVFFSLYMICVLIIICLVINNASLAKDERASDPATQSEEDNSEDKWNPTQFCFENFAQSAIKLDKCITEKNEIIYQTKEELINCKADVFVCMTFLKTFVNIQADGKLSQGKQDVLSTLAPFIN